MLGAPLVSEGKVITKQLPMQSFKLVLFFMQSLAINIQVKLQFRTGI